MIRTPFQSTRPPYPVYRGFLLMLALVSSCGQPPPAPVPTPAPTPVPVSTPSPLPTPTPPPTQTPPPSVTPTPTPTPVDTPTLTPPPAPTVPVVIQKYVAGGTFYVTKDVTVRIPGGLLGIAAGTEVTLIAEKGSLLVVTNGRDQFELNKAETTHDPKLGAAVVKAARTAQIDQEHAQQKQEELLIRQQRERIEYLKTHPLATPSPSRAR